MAADGADQAEHELTTASHDLDVSPALSAFMREGWAPDTPLPAEPLDLAPYAAKRRAALSAAFPGKPIVVSAGRLKVRSNDVHYPFRPNSDFVWLTGCAEPDGVLVMTPDGSGGHASTLFVFAAAPRSASEQFYRDRVHGQLWTGRRPTLGELSASLGLATRPLTELALPTNALTPDDDGLRTALHDLRLVKDDWEIAQLTHAVDATVRGFADVLHALPQATNSSERWIEGTFWRRARTEGNDVGYGTIAAAGANACVLHWTRNDGPVRDGDLLLLDAGVEANSLYTADVTRTLPVNGRFTAAQRQVYDLVYAAQSAGLAAVKPGAQFHDYWRAAHDVLATGLVEWGLLPASARDLEGPDGDLHRRYTLHGTGHMLGLDVHDCAHARSERYHGGELQAGYALTVEPGLYFQTDDLTVPPELRGIGVRIEDDVVVTRDGCRNLSAALPREAAAVEAWIAELGP